MNQGPPTCWKCGYELTGFGVGDVCPECGGRIEALFETPVALDVGGAAFVCGVMSLGSFAFVWVLPGITAIGLPLGCFGMVFALVARRRRLRSPDRLAASSRRHERVGFWLSVPAVVATAAVGVFLVIN